MTLTSFDPERRPRSGGRSARGTSPAPVSHQSVRLGRGRHDSPQQGACVMELASMLAGGPFSDHPASVCPVIGSFLRAYNDAIGDGRRQDLYAYASTVVGSRSSYDVQCARAERLAAWAQERQRGRLRGLRNPLAGRKPAPLDLHRIEAAGAHAVHAIRRHTGQTHAQALALIDELLAIKPGCQTPPTPSVPAGHARAPAAAPVAPTDSPARSHDERASIRLLRARHTTT